MDLPDFVALAQQPPSLRFLLIGGYAVAAHGHTRPTFDVDFLVRQADREHWNTRLEKLVTRVSENVNFAQFVPPEGAPLDLMFVKDETFEKIWATSETRTFGPTIAPVPALDSLLALKLHALKQALPHRTSKDAEDVESLFRRNKLNIEDPKYQELFLKYGTRETYDTFRRILRHS